MKRSSLSLSILFICAYFAHDVTGNDHSMIDILGSYELGPKIEAMCLQRTGSQKVYKNLEVANRNLTICISSKLDLDQFENDLNQLSYSNQTQFLKKYCPNITKSVNCLRPMFSVLVQCFDQDGLEKLNDLRNNAIPHAVSLLCIGRKNIFSKRTAHFVECFQDGLQCFDELFVGLDWSSYGPEECDNIARRRQCVSDRMSECGAPRLGELFEYVFKPLFRFTPCNMNGTFDSEQWKIVN